jgi:ketopantoate reductase
MTRRLILNLGAVGVLLGLSLLGLLIAVLVWKRSKHRSRKQLWRAYMVAS